MLSNEEIKALGRVARVSLDENETHLLCHDLNALLEMASVLESLPRDNSDIIQRTVTLKEMREDRAAFDVSLAEAGKVFSVPPIMEKT